MSPFAKMSIGALWLGNLLYPESFNFDEQRIADLYYGVLLEQEREEYGQNMAYTQMQEAFRRREPGNVRLERECIRTTRLRRAAEAAARMDAGNAREISDDERRIIEEFLAGSSTEKGRQEWK